MGEVAILEERPPYVMFETRTIEDRKATLEAGHYVGKDVDYVLITPTGSKDRIERVAEEWLKKIQRDVQEKRCPEAWFRGYSEAYKLWKEGKEIPVQGTPIVTWPILGPSDVKMFLSAGVRTVEDLAAANEETLMRLGMGARTHKQRAVDWLTAAKSEGKLSAEIHKLRTENANLKIRNAELEARVERLEMAEKQMKAQIAQPGAAGHSAPQKQEVAALDILDN